MRNYPQPGRCRRQLVIVLQLALAGAATTVAGAEPPAAEPADGGWSVELDNDALGVANRDRNFTAGLAITWSGRRTRDNWLSLDTPLGWINSALRVPGGGAWSRRHGIELGMALFTPDDLAASEPVTDDHPYAFPPFQAGSRRDIGPDGGGAYHSTLLVGVLGTGLSGRWGWLASPWWSHTPTGAENVGLSAPGSGRGREFFLWGGAMLRLRAYNALLQGQLRDSRVTFDRNQLRPMVGEVWFGATAAVTSRLRLGLVLRARSPELRAGDQVVPMWGSIIVSLTP